MTDTAASDDMMQIVDEHENEPLLPSIVQEDSSPPRRQQPSSVNLNELLEQRQWERLYDEIQQHPNRAREAVHDGFYINVPSTSLLHRLCKDESVPISLLDVVACAHPTAIFTPGIGVCYETPLHIVSKRHYCMEKLQVLLRYAPQHDLGAVRDYRGSTPLHAAVRYGNSKSMVQMLLFFDANNLLTCQDRNGWTALHIAAWRCRALGVVEALLDAAATVAVSSPIHDVVSSFLCMQDVRGWTALHYACRYGARPCVVQRLLSFAAMQVVTQHEHKTVLGAACDGHAPLLVLQALVNTDETLLSRQPDAIALLYKSSVEADYEETAPSDETSLAMTIRRLGQATSHAPRSATARFDKFWRKIAFLSSRRARRTLDEDSNNGTMVPEPCAMLHGLVRCVPPVPDLVQVVLCMEPQAAHFPDVNGNLPLHVAATAASTNYIEGAMADETPVLEALLRTWPAAISCLNAAGEFPLHLAIRHGLRLEHGLATLLHASPHVLGCVHQATRLYPFQMAAAAAAAARSHHPTTTSENDSYHDAATASTMTALLRMRPDLLR